MTNSNTNTKIKAKPKTARNKTTSAARKLPPSGARKGMLCNTKAGLMRDLLTRPDGASLEVVSD